MSRLKGRWLNKQYSYLHPLFAMACIRLRTIMWSTACSGQALHLYGPCNLLLPLCHKSDHWFCKGSKIPTRGKERILNSRYIHIDGLYSLQTLYYRSSMYTMIHNEWYNRSTHTEDHKFTNIECIRLMLVQLCMLLISIVGDLCNYR